MNIKDVSSVEAQMLGKKKSRRPAPACQSCSMCRITAFSSFIAKTAGIQSCTINNLQPPETFSTCSLEDDGPKGETVMGEKYGSLIAIFILALCVHSNSRRTFTLTGDHKNSFTICDDRFGACSICQRHQTAVIIVGRGL